MSVLCCAVPNLLIALACRQSPAIAGRPLALLGPDERVWAASPQAAQCGVGVQMSPQQAQIACPDLLLRPLDLQAAESEQSARRRWPSELEAVRWTLLETGEIVAPQLTLFADGPQRLVSLADLAQKLAGRYGSCLFQAALPEANHPIPERRSALLPLMDGAAHVAPVA